MTARTESNFNEIAEHELISRILEGQQRLFEHLMRKYNQRLFRLGMSILENDVDVEDAMQSAYINAYLHLTSFEHRASFGTWLTRIMLNQCYEQKRKQRPETSLTEQTDNFISMRTPDNELANKELSHVLEMAIAQLPEKYRLVFVMREIEEMSVRETSSVLNIEEPNVKVRLNRAKTMLRDNLQGYMKDAVYNFHLSRCDRIVNSVMGRLGIA